MTTVDRFVPSSRRTQTCDAADAIGFGGKASPRPTMRLISWRAVAKGALRGFCNIELPSGLILKDVSVFASQGKTWAALPARPVVDRDGRHHVVNEKRQYAPAAEWRSRDLNDRWSAAVVEMIRERYPEAFVDDEVAA